MGFRYRKSFKFGPFRVNLSKSGVGYSMGNKYFRVTKKANGGVRTTTTLPGTGISHVKDYSAKQVKAAVQSQPQSAQQVNAVQSQPAATGGGNRIPTSFVVVVAIFALALVGRFLPSTDRDTKEAAAVEQSDATVRLHTDDPAYFEEMKACFAEAFPDAELSCIENIDVPQVAVHTELSSEAQPEDWSQTLETFGACLSAAHTAATGMGKDTAMGQLLAADGEILASGYKGSVHYDAFAARAAEEAEKKAMQEQRRSSSSSSSRTVYVTPSGSKYHYSSSCNGGSYSATTLDSALSRGLTACKKCT